MNVLAATQPMTRPIEGGVFVAVVGPSGAGKDSVIAFARHALADNPRLAFVRRVITRPCDPDAEDHDTLDEAEFLDAERHGAYALSWGAHGLRYGIPVAADQAIAGGAVAVANLSRNAIPALLSRYADVRVAEVSAAPEILADRLSARGRESRGEVLTRLARSAPLDPAIPGLVRIDNSGPLDVAGRVFTEMLRGILAKAGEQ